MQNRILKILVLLVLIGILAAEASAATTPDDPDFPQQWYLQKIEAPSAWDYTSGSSEIIVAVLDSGFDLNHPDLKENFWINSAEIPANGLDDDRNGFVDDVYGWDFVDNDNTLEPLIDRNFSDYRAVVNHGTLIAGLIGAVGNNNQGVAGLNWKTKIMAVRVLDSQGSAQSSRVVQGLEYALKNGAKIINTSFVGFGSDPALQQILEQAYDQGVIIVTAAGNEKVGNGRNLDQTPMYPICHQKAGKEIIIGVAALDQRDQKTQFSNYGSNCIDISAPGNNIFGTQFAKSNDPEFQEFYGGSWSGTSLAAPLVTGTLALLRALAPNFSNEKIIQALLDNTDVIDQLNPAYAGKLGTGRLNTAKAVSAIQKLLKRIINFSINNGAATTENLDVKISLQAENVTNLRIANGDPLRFPVCDFTDVPERSYNDLIFWRLTEGQKGERVVCLSIDGLEPIYRSIFYTPSFAPTVVGATEGEPFVRDLQKEQEMLPQVLRTFKKLFNRGPDFQNLQDQLAWNTLIYDLSFARNLQKEQVALKKFVLIFKRLPQGSFDWTIIKVLAYVQGS